MCLEIGIVSYLPENISHTQYIMHNVMNNFTVFYIIFFIVIYYLYIKGPFEYNLFCWKLKIL